MEYIQAILFTSKYILGQDGNKDLFYIFAAVALLFYVWKRHDKVALIAKTTAPVLIVCIIMALFYPWVDKFRVLVFFGKILLNMTLMLYVAYNCKKWKITRFVETIVWIQAIETLIALLLPNSMLWSSEMFLDGTERVYRLRLFYLNAGSMAFASGFVLVVLVYQLITSDIIWRPIAGIAVMVADLYLSYGMGGISCAVLAVAAMLVMAYAFDFKNYKSKHKKKFIVTTILSVIFVGFAIVSNDTYIDRAKNILNGTDSILLTKLLQPLESMGNVLRTTHMLGVGFGNANTRYALTLINSNKAYPNSFLRLVAEGGIFGILVILLLIFGLGYYCFKYGSIIDKSLFLYVIAYQFIGGYFTDPTNFFIYGWIVGDCIYNKIKKTGSVRLKMFMPVHKDKLVIAEIGHKRIPSREGGVEIVVEELSKRLVKLGHSVDAYNRSGQHISGEEFNVVDYDSVKEYEGIGIVRIPTIQKKGLAAFVYSFIASIYVVCKDYDVVHYHAEGPCAFIWLPSIFGIRTIATIHGLDWQRTGKWGSLASNVIKFGEKMAVYYADEIIVLSKQVQKYFLTSYNRKTVFIPNGIDRPVKKDANIITEKWGLTNGSYILLLARLTAEKGFHYAIEAFKEIDTDKKLVIAGGASDTGSYVARLKELAGDDERIVFTGFVQGDTLAELFSNAYTYCLPSDLEGMPISLLEAMSYGNCCLVSDISECTSVVGTNAKTFYQGDVENLRKCMEELLNNPELVEDYKSRAADYVCNRYKWDDVVEKTSRLYLGDALE